MIVGGFGGQQKLRFTAYVGILMREKLIRPGRSSRKDKMAFAITQKCDEAAAILDPHPNDF